jgi:MFS transporter, DHA1 family, inner membrane transport protein
MTSSQAPESVSVRRLVLVLFFTRTILNVAYRAVYPFLPFIAADLGVSFQSAAEIVQVRNLVGLSAPLFGPLSDHYGRRTLMLAGLAISVLACLTVGFVSSFVLAVVAIAIINFGMSVYEPAQHAYLADRVPYAGRGRAMSLTEVAWSAASLAGLPLFGIVVQWFGWRMGFVLVGIAGLVVIALTRFGLPEEARGGQSAGRKLWSGSFGLIAREPIAIGVLATSILVLACNENVNIVYAEWMKSSFLLDAIALGSVAFAMGFAELAGELLSSAYVDRIGKHRMVAVSLTLTSGAYILLPLIGQNALWGTLGLALVYFLFELTVVSTLPLITEVVPTSRATLMSLNLAAMLLGRTVGSFTGPFLYFHQGFLVNGLVSGAGMLIAVGIWNLFVTERV